MVKQKAFFYRYNNAPGLGILALHDQEGWQRMNFYSFGVDMDAFLKSLEENCEEQLIEEGMLSTRPAQSKVIIAGGVVFKGLTCLLGEGTEGGGMLSKLEKCVPGFGTIDAETMAEADSLNPMNVYCFTYGRKVVGISRVIFFEYATQMSMVGIYRDQDRNLVDELQADLMKLNEYMTIPSPLRTDERDARVDINMFMIRHPLKEELQADFVTAIMKVPSLSFYST